MCRSSVQKALTLASGDNPVPACADRRGDGRAAGPTQPSPVRLVRVFFPGQPATGQRSRVSTLLGFGVLLTTALLAAPVDPINREAKLADSLRALGASTGLRDLDLTGIPLTDADLTALGHLRHLRCLNLNWTYVDDGGLSRLGCMDELQALSLDGAKITDAGLAWIGQRAQLRHLRLIFVTAVSGTGLRCISQLRHLETLEIGGGNFGDEALAS